MDAMKEMAVKYNIHPEDVEHIKVATGSNVLPPKGPLRYMRAKTGLQAKFCLPFQIVSMVIRRKAGLMEFTDQFVQSPAVQEMMDRVEAVIDPEIDALGRDKIVSVIDVRLKNGKTLRGKSAEHYRGGPRNPLSRGELMEKFNDCVQHTLSPDQGKALWKTIESIEQLDSVATLIEKASVP